MTGGEASLLAARRSAPVPGGHFGPSQTGIVLDGLGTRDHRDPGPTGRQRQRRICIIRHFDKTVTYAQFTLHSHEPVSLLGTDTAVSPAEYILKALPAACYIAALASLATGSAHSKRAHDPRHLGQPGPCHHPPLLTPDGHRQGKPWAGSCTQRGYPHRIALGHEASALRQFVGVGHNWACPQGDFFVSAIHNLPRLGVSKRRDVTRDGHRLPEIIRKAQSRWQGRVAVRHRTTGGAILDLPTVPAPELKRLQVMQFQALPAMKEYAATPLSKPREGAARPAATNKNGPPQGPIKAICTRIHQPKSSSTPDPKAKVWTMYTRQIGQFTALRPHSPIRFAAPLHSPLGAFRK